MRPSHLLLIEPYPPKTQHLCRLLVTSSVVRFQVQHVLTRGGKVSDLR